MAKDHKKRLELEAARKAGLEPAELDEDGKEINPHIPQYMSTAPWYLNTNRPTLKHQKNWKRNKSDHDADNSDNYDAKRDPWKNFDADASYKQVVEMHEAREEARWKYLHNQRLQKLDHEQDEQEDSLKVGDSKQVDFGKVEKRVRTTGGGSTGTVRNLRIREDTAKYLLNLDLNSAHYDPKTRSMREDPLPDMDPNEKFYAGDNGNRATGQALDFKQLNIHAWEVFDKMGHDHVVHVHGAPSQAELLYRHFKINKEKLKSQNTTKAAILEKYGNASAAASDDQEVVLPQELLLGQTEVEVEYDRAGRVVKRDAIICVAKSKYEEDVCINNHTSVWGSWWKDGQWGYKCCHQTFRNTYCTGDAGIEAAAADATKANIDRNIESNKEATMPGDDEIIRVATWGTQVPDDVVLNQKKLSEALDKEDRMKNQERDERKRKYNVKWNDEVSPEDMEAYRMKRVRHDDPIKDFLH